MLKYVGKDMLKYFNSNKQVNVTVMLFCCVFDFQKEFHP